MRQLPVHFFSNCPFLQHNDDRLALAGQGRGEDVDNPVAAESQGIPVRRMRLAVYVVAAFGAGMAGALYFVGNLRISPDAAFSVNWTAFAIFMVVIGGVGRIEGPLVGALVFWGLNKLFSDYGTWYLIGLGLLAIVITLFFKEGLWGYAQRRWGWSLFPTQRHLK